MEKTSESLPMLIEYRTYAEILRSKTEVHRKINQYEEEAEAILRAALERANDRDS